MRNPAILVNSQTETRVLALISSAASALGAIGNPKAPPLDSTMVITSPKLPCFRELQTTLDGESPSL